MAWCMPPVSALLILGFNSSLGKRSRRKSRYRIYLNGLPFVWFGATTIVSMEFGFIIYGLAFLLLVIP